MANQNLSKPVKFLHVVADMPPDSIIMPLKVIFDEREYVVDKIFDVKKLTIPAVSQYCYAYYCKFKNKVRVLYLGKDNKWFVM